MVYFLRKLIISVIVGCILLPSIKALGLQHTILQNYIYISISKDPKALKQIFKPFASSKTYDMIFDPQGMIENALNTLNPGSRIELFLPGEGTEENRGFILFLSGTPYKKAETTILHFLKQQGFEPNVTQISDNTKVIRSSLEEYTDLNLFFTKKQDQFLMSSSIYSIADFEKRSLDLKPYINQEASLSPIVLYMEPVTQTTKVGKILSFLSDYTGLLFFKFISNKKIQIINIQNKKAITIPNRIQSTEMIFRKFKGKKPNLFFQTDKGIDIYSIYQNVRNLSILPSAKDPKIDLKILNNILTQNLNNQYFQFSATKPQITNNSNLIISFLPNPASSFEDFVQSNLTSLKNKGISLKTISSQAPLKLYEVTLNISKEQNTKQSLYLGFLDNKFGFICFNRQVAQSFLRDTKIYAPPFAQKYKVYINIEAIKEEVPILESLLKSYLRISNIHTIMISNNSTITIELNGNSI